MTALWPLQQAIVTTLLADSAFVAVADGPFDGMAPPGYTLPAGKIGYVRMEDSNEADFRTFSRRGYDGGETINIFGRVREDVKKVYAEMERVLNGSRLTLPGGTHIMLRGECRLVACVLERDGVGAQGVVRYDVLTQAVA